MRTLHFEDYVPGWTSSGGEYTVTESEILEFGEPVFTMVAKLLVARRGT